MRQNKNLDDREFEVLQTIVYEYIVTSKPVGSRSFVKKYSFSISPATMRNIMSDLGFARNLNTCKPLHKKVL